MIGRPAALSTPTSRSRTRRRFRRENADDDEEALPTIPNFMCRDGIVRAGSSTRFGRALGSYEGWQFRLVMHGRLTICDRRPALLRYPLPAVIGSRCSAASRSSQRTTSCSLRSRTKRRRLPRTCCSGRYPTAAASMRRTRSSRTSAGSTTSPGAPPAGGASAIRVSRRSRTSTMTLVTAMPSRRDPPRVADKPADSVDRDLVHGSSSCWGARRVDPGRP